MAIETKPDQEQTVHIEVSPPKKQGRLVKGAAALAVGATVCAVGVPKVENYIKGKLHHLPHITSPIGKGHDRGAVPPPRDRAKEVKSALEEVTLPNQVEVVRGQGYGTSVAAVDVASCTPYIFGHHACTGREDFMSGETSARTEADLNMLSRPQTITLRAQEDVPGDDTQWHIEATVDESKLFVELGGNPVQTTTPMDKGMGDSMKEVAEHLHLSANPDASDVTNLALHDSQAAFMSACAPVLEKYAPAGIAKAVKSEVNEVAGLFIGKNPTAYGWLMQLAAKPVHLELEPAGAVSGGADALARAASGTLNSLDAAVNITLPPAPIPYDKTFDIMGGTKKFTFTTYSQSNQCDVSPDVMNYKPDVDYVIEQ